MKYALITYRTIKPLAIYGRILGTGERIRLPEIDGEELVTQGYLIRVAVINGERWAQPMTRSGSS